MAWTDQMVEDLRKMWKEGLTTGEIGRRLGVSKNSIVGKVHRLGLSGRPSPIKKKADGEPAKSREPKSSVKTEAASKPKAEKQSVSAEKTATAASTPKPKDKVEKNEPVEENKVIASSTVNEERSFKTRESEMQFMFRSEAAHSLSPSGFTSLTSLDNHTCRWPIGDPKDENFHFCGKKVRLGQTYCEEHAALAYVKPNTKK